MKTSVASTPQAARTEPARSPAGRSLAGQVSLVTGGGRGLGRAFAVGLAKAGASVAVSARTAAELAETEAQITDAGRRALAVVGDVADPAAVERTVVEVERQLGPIDVLVNNAGRFRAIGPLWEVDPDEWWRDVEVNLRGPFLFSHAVLAGMISRGRGRVINISSGAGLGSGPGYTAYNASKTALTRLTEALAAELQRHGVAGVSVFAVGPGTVRTAMTEHLLEDAYVTQWAPWVRRRFDHGQDDPAEAAVQRVVRLASGEADALSGCHIRLVDDFDDLVRRAEEIRQGELLKLRLRAEPSP